MLVLGDEARKHGLATSLLERLLYTYKESTMPPNFANKMISLLKCCHRCHEDILGLSARLFYKANLTIPENEPSLPHPKFPHPLLFVCSSINEDAKAKSTNNEDEAKIVLEYAELVAANWSKRLWGGQYHLDMCAMSPTRSQVSINNYVYIEIFMWCMVTFFIQLATILKLIKSGSKLKEVRRVPTFFMQGN